MFDLRSVSLGDVQILAMNIGRAAQAMHQKAGCGGCIRRAVDENERACRGVFVIRIESQRAGRCEVADADFVQSEALGCEFIEAVDIEPIF
jgi:hypothetical protein